MMTYCENCMRFTEPPRCPRCKNKKLREAEPNDPVFLMEKDAIIAASIEDILAQNSIPCIKRPLLGAGITAHIGYIMETFAFYVPYAAYDNAKELLSNFLESEG